MKHHHARHIIRSKGVRNIIGLNIFRCLGQSQQLRQLLQGGELSPQAPGVLRQMLVGVLDTQLHNGQVLPFLRVDQADFFASLILQPGKQQFLVLQLSVQSDPGRHPVPHRVVPFDQSTAGGRQILRRIQ